MDIKNLIIFKGKLNVPCPSLWLEMAIPKFWGNNKPVLQDLRKDVPQTKPTISKQPEFQRTDNFETGIKNRHFDCYLHHWNCSNYANGMLVLLLHINLI